jgi:hypothetical protein
VLLFMAVAVICLKGFATADTEGKNDVKMDTQMQQQTNDSPVPAEIRLIDLINQARQKPIETIASFGMDPAKVVRDNADIAEVLENGLPPLDFNQNLYRAAAGHAKEMLENNYYSYGSLDGSTPENRLSRAGYAPIFAGEHLGMIFFNNFIPPENAANWIFQNMLEDELASERTEILKIFNPQFRHLGVSVQGGAFQLEQFKANVYLAVCDFARGAEIWELQLLNLINQFRADPWPVLAQYGIEVDKTDFPELETLLDEGLPPLRLNVSLYKAAETLVTDMFENGHFNAKTADGKALEDRAMDSGYPDAAWLAESRGRFSTCGQVVSPAMSVEKMFRYLLGRAFQVHRGNRHYPMLTPWAQDCGIRILAGESEVLGGICGNKLHIFVADFGAEKVNSDPNDSEMQVGRLEGLVYQDANDNGIYDCGEGYPGSYLSFDKQNDSDSYSYKILTNPAGGFDTELEKGNYRIQIQIGDNRFFKWIHVDPESVSWLSIPIKTGVQTPNGSGQ